jgi:gliding motility-associated-like protein
LVFTDSSRTTSRLGSWVWDLGLGAGPQTFNNQTSPAASYLQPGTYTASLKVQTASGCASQVFQKTFKIGDYPQPGFLAPDNCLSDPFSQFTDTSRISDGTQSQFQYLWHFGDANATPGNPDSSALQNPRHKYSAVGNYTVSLTVTSNLGCAANTSKPFIINGILPRADFTVVGGTDRCSNQPLVLTNQSTVDFGKVVKTEVYWDYANDPTNKLTDIQPGSGKSYTHIYPEFYQPDSINYTLRLVAYSGINCLNSASQVVTLKRTPQLQFAAIPAVCANAPSFTITEASELNGLPGTATFSGRGVASDGTFAPAAAGPGVDSVTYLFMGVNGCTNKIQQAEMVYPVPVVSAGPDITVLEGGSATLQATASGNQLTYLWSPAIGLSSTTALQPLVTPANTLAYTIQATSADGCVASGNVLVTVLKTPSIPNVFTPNGDGINDRWEIKYLDSYPGCTVEIFNRYGQLVFQSTGYAKPWDGTYKGSPLPAATYYYIINPKNGRKQMSGFVDIVR